MGEQYESSVIHRDHHMIASDRQRATPQPTPLGEHVRKERQLGASCLMVGLPVVGNHHRASTRREDGHPEPDEALRRFRADQRTPAPRRRSVAAIDRHEVYGVRRSHQVRPVARHPTRRAVANLEPATKRKAQQNWCMLEPRTGHGTSSHLQDLDQLVEEVSSVEVRSP
jgi:hypothetical protein